MKRNGTVWLDLTDLQEWSGHFTGVQRVVFEYATRLASDKSLNVRFLRFNQYHKDIEEIRYEDVFSNENDTHSTQVEGVHMDVKDRIKQQLIRVSGSLPPFLQEQLTQDRKKKLKQVAKKVYRGAQKAKHSAAVLKHRLVRNVQPSSYKAVTLTDQDTVLIVGKLWDYPEYVDLLSVLKQKVGFRYIQIIHDIIPVYQRHLFGDGLFEPFSTFLFEAVSGADELVCISDSTAADVRFFAKDIGIQKELPIKRIQLGDTPKITAESTRPGFVSDKEKFILTVGTVEVRKNHQLLYTIYKLAHERGIVLPKLIVVGGNGWLTENMRFMVEHDAETKDIIVFKSGVSDTELKWLYQNCLFTVYPSIYEGWGLPVRESLAYGKYCITTKRSSLPEAGGVMAGYASGYDANEFLEKIIETLDNLTAITKKTQKYQPYTWDQSYETLRSIIS